MDEPRVVVTTEELTRKFVITLAILSQRQPALVRDLWTRKGEQADRAKQEHARHELARSLAEHLATAKHVVTRPETNSDRLGQDLKEDS